MSAEVKQAEKLLEQAKNSFEHKNYRQALNDFTQLLESTKDKETFYSRSICQFELKDYKECIDDLKEVINFDPKDINAYYQKAKALKELGRNKESVKNYITAVNLAMEAAGHLEEEKDKLKSSYIGRAGSKRRVNTTESDSQIYFENITEGSVDSEAERVAKKKIEEQLNKQQNTELLDSDFRNIAGTKIIKKERSFK